MSSEAAEITEISETAHCVRLLKSALWTSALNGLAHFGVIAFFYAHFSTRSNATFALSILILFTLTHSLFTLYFALRIGVDYFIFARWAKHFRILESAPLNADSRTLEINKTLRQFDLRLAKFGGKKFDENLPLRTLKSRITDAQKLVFQQGNFFLWQCFLLLIATVI